MLLLLYRNCLYFAIIFVIHGRMNVRTNSPCLHERINPCIHTGSAPYMRNLAAKQRKSPDSAPDL